MHAEAPPEQRKGLWGGTQEPVLRGPAPAPITQHQQWRATTHFSGAGRQADTHTHRKSDCNTATLEERPDPPPTRLQEGIPTCCTPLPGSLEDGSAETLAGLALGEKSLANHSLLHLAGRIARSSRAPPLPVGPIQATRPYSHGLATQDSSGDTMLLYKASDCQERVIKDSVEIRLAKHHCF